jgi:hypothetical protein
MDLSFWETNKKKIVVGIVIVSLVFFITTVLLSFKRSSQLTSQSSLPVPTSSPVNQPTSIVLPSQPLPSPPQTPRPPPSIKFDTYDNKVDLPQVPQNVNSYKLKTDYLLDEVLSFGKKLGLNEYKVADDNYVILYNFKEANNMGMMTFNRKTGTFSFQSYGVHKLENSNLKSQMSKLELAKEYLNQLGVIDQTVSCPVTYQKQGLTDITYVECHRD